MMMDYLNKLGADVDIIVREPQDREVPGHTRVLSA